MIAQEALAYSPEVDCRQHPALLAMRHGNGFWDLPIAAALETQFGLSPVDTIETQDSRECLVYEVSTDANLGDRFAWVMDADLKKISGNSRAFSPSTVAIQALSSRFADECRDMCPAPGLSLQEWNLMVVKPDAIEKELEDHIIESVVATGIQVVDSRRNIAMTYQDVETLWPLSPGEKQPEGSKEWWEETKKYMCEGPVSFYLMSGPNATSTLYDYKQQIRKTYYGQSSAKPGDTRPVAKRVRSLIHTSETTQELLQNIAMHWTPNEVTKFMRQYGKVQ